jgi:hypothetical protein
MYVRDVILRGSGGFGSRGTKASGFFFCGIRLDPVLRKIIANRQSPWVKANMQVLVVVVMITYMRVKANTPSLVGDDKNDDEGCNDDDE